MLYIYLPRTKLVKQCKNIIMKVPLYTFKGSWVPLLNFEGVLVPMSHFPAKLLNQNRIWVVKLPLIASQMSSTLMSGFRMCWKYWIMIWENNYWMKINASIGQKWFIDIDWLILVNLLISTYLTQWFDLLNHFP